MRWGWKYPLSSKLENQRREKIESAIWPILKIEQAAHTWSSYSSLSNQNSETCWKRVLNKTLNQKTISQSMKRKFLREISKQAK